MVIRVDFYAAVASKLSNAPWGLLPLKRLTCYYFFTINYTITLKMIAIKNVNNKVIAKHF